MTGDATLRKRNKSLRSALRRQALGSSARTALPASISCATFWLGTGMEGIVEVAQSVAKVPPSVVVLKDRTRRLYLCWWMTHYAVGFIGVLAGTVLTALTSAGTSSAPGSLASYAWLIGIVAAVSTSLVTFLGPIHKAERYWSAYHILDQACLEYEQGFIELRPFLFRVRQARRILQAVDPDERFSGDAHKDNQPRTRARGVAAA